MDADVSDYFTTIPHGPLLRRVTRRVTDGQILSTLKRWLTVPAWERTSRGAPLCTTEGGPILGARARHRVWLKSL